MKRIAKLNCHLCAGSDHTVKHARHILRNDGSISMFPEDSAGGILSPVEMKHYEEFGYVVVKKLFNKSELDTYRERFDKLCSEEVTPEPTMLLMRDVALVKQRPNEPLSSETVTKIQDFQDDPVLFEFCKHPKLVPYVKAFCGANFRSIHSMLINKPPDLGKATSRHPFHQDMYYFPFDKCDRIVASWVAMEHVHRGNGCLAVLPGSHKGPCLDHDNVRWEGGANHLYHGVQDEIDMDSRVHLEMETGDCVFFHPHLIHGSGKNATNGFRKAISCHYASGNCLFCTDMSKIMPLVEEGIEMRLKSTPISKSDIPTDLKMRLFHEHWKTKSRQILGPQLPHWDLSDTLPNELMETILHVVNSK